MTFIVGVCKVTFRSVYGQSSLHCMRKRLWNTGGFSGQQDALTHGVATVARGNGPSCHPTRPVQQGWLTSNVPSCLHMHEHRGEAEKVTAFRLNIDTVRWSFSRPAVATSPIHP